MSSFFLCNELVRLPSVICVLMIFIAAQYSAAQLACSTSEGRSGPGSFLNRLPARVTLQPLSSMRQTLTDYVEACAYSFMLDSSC